MARGVANSEAVSGKTRFHLQQAFKLALSMVLFYWLALWTNWDVPKYGALAIVIVSLGTTGATIEKGVMRLLGTTVGVVVGFLILGLFNHDRWATMLALACYITLIGYFMQGSRNSYAWYVAAFVPLVIWGDNYPNFDSAFYFGTFRFLQTTAGVLIYTAVDIVFWPRRAGDEFYRQGDDLWAEIRELFMSCRSQLAQDEPSDKSSELRAKVAGTLARTLASLEDAFADTSSVIRDKRVWQAWRASVKEFVEALELWRETIADCRKTDIERLLPDLDSDLLRLDKRLERISDLWQDMQIPGIDSDDRLLAEPLALALVRSADTEWSHFERAAVANFLKQSRNLDRTSRELLRTMRVLAGLDPRREIGPSSLGPDRERPSGWDPGRLLHALYPATVFIAAFLFWVFMNPPTGAAVPMLAGILALVILRTPMNPIPLLAVLLASVLFVVTPVYWLVMPALSSGIGLLSLVFVYSFLFGFLGGRSPALKSGPIIMFVVMTGISNQQSYSFQGVVDGAVMVLLAGTIVTAVYFLFSPMRPEQALLGSSRRFFSGCAGVMGELAQDRPLAAERGRRIRKRRFDSMVLPAPRKILALQQQLDYKLYPDNTPAKVQRLHDCLQSIVYRLQSLELAYDRLVRDSADFPDANVRLGNQVSEALQRVFRRWAILEPGDAFETERGTLHRLSRELLQQFDVTDADRNRQHFSDRALADRYAMLGTVRGLIEAMANTQGVINQINWSQWATPRF